MPETAICELGTLPDSFTPPQNPLLSSRMYVDVRNADCPPLSMCTQNPNSLVKELQ